MTLAVDNFTEEAQWLIERGVPGLLRDRGQFIRAAKAYLDCAMMIERFGPLPVGYIHGGWPWDRQLWRPHPTDAKANIVKAAALLILESDRLDEQNHSIHQASKELHEPEKEES